ncbi:MAG: hypothetical protein ACLQME_07895 [Alphaproteobacteria bacterium]
MLFLRPGMWVLIALAVIALAQATNFWPHMRCQTVRPFGQHDYECTYFIGR